MASSQDIDHEVFVRPKRVPPPSVPLVDGLPIPVSHPYHLPNDRSTIGSSGAPHRKPSLPASPDIPTIPTVDSDGELGHIAAVGSAGPGSKLSSTSAFSTSGAPISKPRAMSRMTPYGGNPAAPKKKGVFGAFTLGRGRSTFRPSMLSKSVVVVQPGPSVSVHVPTGVVPPPQVEMAMRRSKSAPPHKGRGRGFKVHPDSAHAAERNAGEDSEELLGIPMAVEIVRSMTIGDVQIGTMTIQELEPVSDMGSDEGIADVGSDEVGFEIVGEGYDIRRVPDVKMSPFVRGGNSPEDSSFELVGYPGVDSAEDGRDGTSSSPTSGESASDAGAGAPVKIRKGSGFGSAPLPPESRTSLADNDSALNEKVRKQLEKEEAQSRKAISKILREESKMEKQSLKIAITELETLQRAHKESMKLEANAITGHSKTKSEHTKSLSLFEGLKKEYQIMERKVETSAIVLKQADEALEQHKVRVREAMGAVKQKKDEVVILRAHHVAEERERVLRLSGLKKDIAPVAAGGDDVVPETTTRQKHRSRFMAPL